MLVNHVDLMIAQTVADTVVAVVVAVDVVMWESVVDIVVDGSSLVHQALSDGEHDDDDGVVVTGAATVDLATQHHPLIVTNDGVACAAVVGVVAVVDTNVEVAVDVHTQSHAWTMTLLVMNNQ